tara:strand:- start:101 stop:268 length:168 start_codon:yes stop_codon:yes gene_type:complete
MLFQIVGAFFSFLTFIDHGFGLQIDPDVPDASLHSPRYKHPDTGFGNAINSALRG